MNLKHGYGCTLLELAAGSDMRARRRGRHAAVQRAGAGAQAHAGRRGEHQVRTLPRRAHGGATARRRTPAARCGPRARDRRSRLILSLGSGAETAPRPSTRGRTPRVPFSRESRGRIPGLFRGGRARASWDSWRAVNPDLPPSASAVAARAAAAALARAPSASAPASGAAPGERARRLPAPALARRAAAGGRRHRQHRARVGAGAGGAVRGPLLPEHRSAVDRRAAVAGGGRRAGGRRRLVGHGRAARRPSAASTTAARRSSRC